MAIADHSVASPAPRTGLGTRHLPDAAIGAGIFAVAVVFFAIALGSPDRYCFDESYYVPAARSVFDAVHVVNAEHPVLAKMFIRLGILLLGDRPVGWRAPGVIAGAAIVAGLYTWARLLFRARGAALFVAAVTLVDQCLYLLARTAVLDVFATAFIVWALVFETRSTLSRRPAGDLAICGALLGLAAACKWTGVFALAVVVLIAAGRRAGILLRRRFAGARLWRGSMFRVRRSVGPLTLVACLFALPLGVYFASFLPVYGLDWRAILARQEYMLHYQTSRFGTQPFNSPWWGWPIPLRPFYFFWQLVPVRNHGNGIIYLGNPVISWAGLAAIGAAIGRFASRRDRASGAIVAAWAGLYLPWAFTGRNVTYVYYYFPAYLILGLALALVLFGTRPRAAGPLPYAFLGIAAAVFVYFLPLSVASIGFTIPALEARLWLPGWH